MTSPTGTRGVATAAVTRRLGAALLLAALAACDAARTMRGGTGLDFSTVDEPVSFPNGALTITGRLFVPEGPGPFRAAIVLHGCEGMLQDSVVGDTLPRLDDTLAFWGRTLREPEGLVVLIVDSYTPRQIPAGCGTTDTLLQDSIVNADTLINEVTDRVSDAFAALEFLRGKSYVDGNAVGLFGFGSGGGATLSAMAKNDLPVALPAQGGFRTAVAFYPDCKLRGRYGSTTAGNWLPYGPTHLLHGALDTLQAGCVERVARAAQLGADSASLNPVAITSFAGAKRGFDRAVENDTAWTAADRAARDQARQILLDILRALQP